MSRFMLVDLTSPAEFIPRQVRWPHECFLAWLEQYGEVEPIEIRFPFGGAPVQWYKYYSWSGLQTMFRLTDERELLIFIGDHTFKQAWSTSSGEARPSAVSFQQS